MFFYFQIKPEYDMEFPAVTVCNMNPIKSSAMGVLQNNSKRRKRKKRYAGENTHKTSRAPVWSGLSSKLLVTPILQCHLIIITFAYNCFPTSFISNSSKIH